MFKKLLSSFLVLSVLAVNPLFAPVAYAADAKILFEVDCNTLNKNTLVGFQSDPADAANGPEIIAFEFTVKLTPQSGSTLSDLQSAKFEANAAYQNMIIAQNTSSEVSGARQLKIAGGFTQQTGLNNVKDLLSIVGVSQKAYKIEVVDGKLFPKSGGDDIYKEQTPARTFIADPSSCQNTTPTTPTAQVGQQNVVIDNFAFTPAEVTIEVGQTVQWTNADSTNHTVTSVGAGGLNSGPLANGQSYQKTFTEAGTYEYQCSIHPSMTGKVIVTAPAGTPTTTTTGTTTTPSASTTTTSITLSSDVQQGAPGDPVTVTAKILNLNGQSIEWSQSAGTRIQPNINNQATSDTETTSTLAFSMPTPATDIVLRLKVGETTETITVAGTDNPTANAAGTDTTGTDTASTGTTTDTGSDVGTLQERLEQRRTELEATANPTAASNPTGTLHSAAGSGLAQSGPEHTLALMVIAGLVVMWRRKKVSQAAEAV